MWIKCTIVNAHGDATIHGMIQSNQIEIVEQTPKKEFLTCFGRNFIHELLTLNGKPATVETWERLVNKEDGH